MRTRWASARANYVPLSPVQFLERSALIWPTKIAVRHGSLAYTYAEFETRCRRLASALAQRGIGRGDTVAVMAPNIPAAARGALRGAGAGRGVKRAQLPPRRAHHRLLPGARRGEGTAGRRRVRADGAGGALRSSTGRSWSSTSTTPRARAAAALGALDYAALLAEGDPGFLWPGPEDEWDALALLYTSGTTGDPKGVVYHHRGAYLNALGNALAFGLKPDSVYLWTLPMFHCSGWTYTWAVTAGGGTHVCLRRVDPARIFSGHPRAPRDASVRGADRAQHAGARAGGGEAALRAPGRGRHRWRGAAVSDHRSDGSRWASASRISTG